MLLHHLGNRRKELINVSEVAVDARESDVCNLIYLMEPLHHKLPEFFGGYFITIDGGNNIVKQVADLVI